jgi:hypothetical protein
MEGFDELGGVPEVGHGVTRQVCPKYTRSGRAPKALDGTAPLHAIDWQWTLGDASGAVEPTSLVNELTAQIDGDGTAPPCPANGGIQAAHGNRVYKSPRLAPSVLRQGR